MTEALPKVLPLAFRETQRVVWRSGAASDLPPSRAPRRVPEEVPVAFSYEGASYAVMMASPADLDDFAVGFSLSEGLIGSVDDIKELGIVAAPNGIVLRMALSGPRADAFWARRRHLAGPSGCGLCGLESLDEAARTLPVVSSRLVVSASAIFDAMATLPAQQPLNRLTGALHAAAFWRPGEGIVHVREDVGRHNALDKLIGAAARAGIDGGSGAVLLTSRVSVEMVQKVAMFGAPLVVAVSAPTALAVRAAENAGITLVAVARQDGFEVFTHPGRVAADRMVAAG